MNRICKGCGKSKPIEDFSLEFPRGNPYRRYKCKSCRQKENLIKRRAYYGLIANAAQRKQYAENPEPYKALSRMNNRLHPEWNKSSKLRNNYNLSLAEYNDLLNKQDGKCRICGETEKSIDTRTNKIRDLSVDHDHTTGKVRGLLCVSCNNGLGRFKHNTEYLTNAINYLNSSQLGV